jgi:hypothetical protein
MTEHFQWFPVSVESCNISYLSFENMNGWLVAPCFYNAHLSLVEKIIQG